MKSWHKKEETLHLLVTYDTAAALEDSFQKGEEILKQLFFCLNSKCYSIQNFKSYQIVYLRVYMSGIWEIGLSHNRDE